LDFSVRILKLWNLGCGIVLQLKVSRLCEDNYLYLAWVTSRGGVTYRYRGQHDSLNRASVGRGKWRLLLGQLREAFRRRGGQGEFEHAGLSEDADFTRRKANFSLDLLRKSGAERSTDDRERLHTGSHSYLLRKKPVVFSDHLPCRRFSTSNLPLSVFPPEAPHLYSEYQFTGMSKTTGLRPSWPRIFSCLVSRSCLLFSVTLTVDQQKSNESAIKRVFDLPFAQGQV
jgi:hypothetical protein